MTGHIFHSTPPAIGTKSHIANGHATHWQGAVQHAGADSRIARRARACWRRRHVPSLIAQVSADDGAMRLRVRARLAVICQCPRGLTSPGLVFSRSALVSDDFAWQRGYSWCK
jgi:hypothetical protein